ncbi:hypothetical protein D9619_010078 [Psilocybe cf. subviscida]|uniref:F-box domain-containing protein n=1 Tax=Psilocybe cf. subviscida TaxID=2480587 RepID=A0A8H5BLR9_9AGAR|nr:hypothetical protein D9619_010078 [Psilocybe cf. subviscida]
MRRRDLQIIDEEVSTHHQRIRELNTRRNTYAEISILPQELLVDIFLLVQNNSPLEDWHQIAHVCRHWRHTAVNTAILWTEPPTRHPDYTDLMLYRSKRANLNIVLGSEIPTATITSILSHIGRIQTLQMALSMEELTDVCKRFIVSGHMLLQLESLNIRCLDLSGFGVTTKWRFTSILIRQSSSLRSLCLTRVAFDWQMLAPFDLVSLHLIDIGLVDKISTKTLLDTFRQMPLLQHLSLSLADLLRPGDVPAIQASKVALPCLESLNVIECKSLHIPYLLSHLLLPRLNRLQIDASARGENEGYYSNTLATIMTTIKNGDFRVGGRLFVERRHISIAALGCDRIFVTIWLPKASNTYHEIQCTQQFLKQIVSTYNGLAQVTLGIPLNSDELVEIFSNTHQLKAISIYGHNSLVFALNVALAYRTGHNSQNGARVFSSLDTIGCDNVEWDEIDSSVVTNFCHTLLQRSNYATPIKTIYCFNPLPEWAMEMLEDGGICVSDGEVPGALYWI